LNSTEIQDANSRAISLWANVPPSRPDFYIIAVVLSIQRFGVITKLLSPACFLNPSNSTGLKSELKIVSQKPNNSMNANISILK